MNHLVTLGRRAFAELTEVYRIESDFAANVAGRFPEMVARVVRSEAHEPGRAAVG